MANRERWTIEPPNSIKWNVADDTHLPHSDHVEMTGLNVSVIVHYTVTDERQLELSLEAQPKSRFSRLSSKGISQPCVESSLRR